VGKLIYGLGALIIGEIMGKRRYFVKKCHLILGIALVFVAFSLLSLTFYFQQRVDANNDLLSKTIGKSIPKMHYESIIYYNSCMRIIIPLLIVASMIFVIVAFYLLLLPKVKASALVLALLCLIPMFFPTALSAGTERWYAELYLLQPRDASAIGGHIYTYDNYLSDDTLAFVAFRMFLIRVDTVWNLMEWLEVGYFEDHTGFWIYAASYLLGKGYVEIDWSRFNGAGANGEGYYNFEIGQKQDLQTGENVPNVFRAYFEHYLLMEVTFAIGGDNLYLVGSESNDVYNTLNGHYAGLWYCKNNKWYDWTDVKPVADPPYSVTMSSTNGFYTAGGGNYISPPLPEPQPPSYESSWGGGGRTPRPW